MKDSKNLKAPPPLFKSIFEAAAAFPCRACSVPFCMHVAPVLLMNSSIKPARRDKRIVFRKGERQKEKRKEKRQKDRKKQRKKERHRDRQTRRKKPRKKQKRNKETKKNRRQKETN